jgi:hypothetical protein
VKGILADVNIEGQVDLLVARMMAEPWKLYWDYLQLQYLHFADAGLSIESPDLLVWTTCQEQGLVLITDNRNQDSRDLLESAIRGGTTASSIPVLTIADVQKFRHSREYVDRVVERVLEALLQIDTLLGTGRLFVP